LRTIIFTLFLIICIYGEPEVIKPRKIHDTSVAIIIDSLSYKYAAEEVKSYQNALNDESLSAFIIVNNWHNPDQVKKEVQMLRKQVKILEGIVLIGDIPIPMIRDAQHMTSAFKIDQSNKRFGLQGTSVPSDRFYDDPDLKWEYIQQDTLNPLLYYYRLSPDSPQRIRSDYYSGRIKVPGEGPEKYSKLKTFLQKIVNQKKQTEKLDHMLVFTGHGYHSEALDAWSSALLTYQVQFPELFTNGNRFKYFNHASDAGLKTIILSELQKPQLDLAIFHAHGAEDTQYLLGYEPASSITQNVDAIKLFLRSKLRQAKRRKSSLEETKQYYIKNYNVSEEWFEGTFDDSLVTADSLLSASQDIHLEDIQAISPAAQFIVFDECFNGAFNNPEFVAGSYLFTDGETIAAMANSVNVKQDLWADHNMGLLAQGVRVGQLVKMNNYLESHIIGDPTFSFKADSQIKFNKILASGNVPKKQVKKWLDSDSSPLRALAVSMLITSDENKLIEIYQNDTSPEVRMQALKCLADTRSAAFENILFEATQDNSEFIRRMATIWMGDIGIPEYIPILANLRVNDPSERVQFNAKSSLDQIDPEKSWQECKKLILALPQSVWRDAELKQTESSFNRTKEWLWDELIKNIEDTSLTVKKRISAVRTFRNYRFQKAIPKLIEVSLDQNQDDELRITLLEALGWFTFSSQRKDILNACNEVLSRKDEKEGVAQVALMTKNRLLEGPTNSITP
jgi:hypothetical protein